MGAGRRSGRTVITTVKRASADEVKKVVTDFPPLLFMETERAARDLGMNRSAFIRHAVEAYLETLRRKKLGLALADSLLANADLDHQLLQEFKHVDGADVQV
jgi:hypothetical protein